jgi:hypothetical protein
VTARAAVLAARDAPDPLVALTEAAEHAARLLAFAPTSGLGRAGLAALGDALEDTVMLASHMAPELLPPFVASAIAALPRHAANDPDLRAETLSSILVAASADGRPEGLALALTARDFAAAHGLRRHAALACGLAAHHLAPTPSMTTTTSRQLDLQMFHLAGPDADLADIAASRLLDPEALQA